MPLPFTLPAVLGTPEVSTDDLDFTFSVEDIEIESQFTADPIDLEWSFGTLTINEPE